MVGWGKGVLYLTSPGCPIDTGWQLGKACYPCSKLVKRGNVFISSVFFTFIFLFLPCPSSPLWSLLSLFSLSLRDDPRVDESLNSQHNPIDTGWQLGKACYPCSKLVKRGNVFISSVFFYIHFPLSTLSLISSMISFISLLPFSKRRPKGWRVFKLPTQSNWYWLTVGQGLLSLQ